MKKWDITQKSADPADGKGKHVRGHYNRARQEQTARAREREADKRRTQGERPPPIKIHWAYTGPSSQ